MKGESVEIETFDELTAPDERSLHFTPWGLGPAIAPEAAAEFQQRVIVRADLAPAVPESTRQSFERLRTLHAYGVLSYDLFTVVDDLSLFVIEQALAERFIAHYEGNIPFARSDGTKTRLVAKTFSEVYEALRNPGGPLYRGGWLLELPSLSTTMRFRANLTDLFDWARREGLLHGQRNRRIESVLVHMRNMAAHPRGYHLGSPVESARSIRDTAEIINRLWGVLTPGGRLYPAPVRREIFALGWDEAGSSSVLIREDQLRAGQLHAGWTCVVVRAVSNDEMLWWYRSRYEVTALPTDWLWGPGGGDDAIAWLDANRPSADAVEYLDRWFVIRPLEDEPVIAQRPDVVAGLGETDRRGTWYLVRADFPTDASAHVRAVVSGDSECEWSGPCRRCAADLARVGSWDDVVGELAARGVRIRPIQVADVRVPSSWDL